MFSVRAQCFAAVLAALVAVSAEAVAQADAASSSSHSPAAEVQSVAVVPGDNGPVVQVVSSRPLTPSLQILEGPPRLVIDLPDAKLGTTRRRIPFRNEQIKGIRIDQYQSRPGGGADRGRPCRACPLHLGRDGEPPADSPACRPVGHGQADSVSALTAGVQPAAVPVRSAAREQWWRRGAGWRRDVHYGDGRDGGPAPDAGRRSAGVPGDDGFGDHFRRTGKI